MYTGRKRAEDKSNEKTAVPGLIEEPDIEDAVVGIDAVGCQRDTADRIVEKKDCCLLAVKQNQSDLPADLSCGFKACLSERGVFARTGNMITGVMKHASVVS
ncbi:Transposase [Bacteroidales bacterium Barb6]|nr:Transposase [Bacteroidales bacterium Barb6]